MPVLSYASSFRMASPRSRRVLAELRHKNDGGVKCSTSLNHFLHRNDLSVEPTIPNGLKCNITDEGKFYACNVSAAATLMEVR